MSDIAQRGGVSISVVSRVLNGDPRLRTRRHTEAQILQIAKEINYTPSHAGRALRLAPDQSPGPDCAVRQ